MCQNILGFVTENGIIIQCIIAPLVIGIMSGFIANYLSEKNDREKLVHATKYFKKQTQIIAMKVLLSIRLFAKIHIDSTNDEAQAIIFIKNNLLDKIESYKKTIMYPIEEDGKSFIHNLIIVRQEIAFLHNQLLSFKFPDEQLLHVTENLGEKIDSTLTTFQVFPEIIQTTSNFDFDPARENLFLNCKELAELSFKYRNEIK